MALFRLITRSSGTKTHGLSEVLRTIPVSEMYLPKNLWSLVALSSPSPQTFWRKILTVTLYSIIRQVTKIGTSEMSHVAEKFFIIQ